MNQNFKLILEEFKFQILRKNFLRNAKNKNIFRAKNKRNERDES